MCLITEPCVGVKDGTCGRCGADELSLLGISAWLLQYALSRHGPVELMKTAFLVSRTGIWWKPTAHARNARSTLMNVRREPRGGQPDH